MGTVLFIVTMLFAVFIVGTQVLVRRQAAALKGAPAPNIPGPLGAKIGGAKRALVYFFSPQCGACKAITPRVRALSSKNPDVFAVDVMQHMEIAQALKVMATPSTVEIEDGKIVGYHIGPIPPDVMSRFA